jgi:hypothetical protein
MTITPENITEKTVELLNLTIKIETLKGQFQYSAAKTIEKSRNRMFGVNGLSTSIKKEATNIARNLLEHHLQDGQLKKSEYIEGVKKLQKTFLKP